MARQLSAGILLYRRNGDSLQVFIVHPGGPFWAGKDDGAWSIPKGEYSEGEEPLDAAKREFREETGFDVNGAFLRLTPVRQPSGKLISAWVLEGNIDPARLHSNTFRMQWPPRSGLEQEFPEIDRGEWAPLDVARRKLVAGQRPLLDELARLIQPGHTP